MADRRTYTYYPQTGTWTTLLDLIPKCFGFWRWIKLGGGSQPRGASTPTRIVHLLGSLAAHAHMCPDLLWAPTVPPYPDAPIDFSLEIMPVIWKRKITPYELVLPHIASILIIFLLGNTILHSSSYTGYLSVPASMLIRHK